MREFDHDFPLGHRQFIILRHHLLAMIDHSSLGRRQTKKVKNQKIQKKEVGASGLHIFPPMDSSFQMSIRSEHG